MKIFIRLILSYFITVGAIKLMGKRQLGELQAGELVVALFISDIATNSVTNPDVSFLSCILPALTLVSLEMLCSFAAARVPFFRRIFDTPPAILIREGRLCVDELMKNRLTPEELMSQLRLCGVFDPSNVDCAILEPSGSLTVKQKTVNCQATVEDVMDVLAAFSKESGAKPELHPEGVARAVIINGTVKDAALEEIGKNREWLIKALSENGAKGPEDVFLMTADKYGHVFFAEAADRKDGRNEKKSGR